MPGKISLPLYMDKRNLFIESDLLKIKKENLEQFIASEKNMMSIEFAKKVLPSNEVQSNNMVEGYYDDIEKINFIVRQKNAYKSTRDEEKRRILNLVSGYSYVLKGKEINKNTLKELYDILSKGLLTKEELKNMGEFYRTDDVFIYYSDNICKEPDLGVKAHLITEKMDALFTFINNYSLGETLTDEFIKSQIIHFYFVYIHPYFDINGRTARTTSLWHLLNEKAYPFVIFNRGIQIDKSKYYKIIRDVKKYSNINYFLDFMLDSVLMELKKECVMQSIKESSSQKLTATDYQTLHYLLSINGLCTALDFVDIYNSCNEKKRAGNLYEQMLLPLLEKDIIIKGRDTKRHISSDLDNFIIELNPKFIDEEKDLSGIKILKKES